MEKVEYLVTLSSTIRELWAELEAIAPGQTNRLRGLLGEVSEAEGEAKKDLRSMGAGDHVVDGRTFKVKSGGAKTVFDLDDVLFEAEDNGHLDALLDAGFIKYAVDGKQLERLPDHIKPMYQEMATEKTGTARVYLPKDLCK